MLSVKYITHVHPHWLSCHYPSTTSAQSISDSRCSQCTTFLWDLRFLQGCAWGFRSSGRRFCVTTRAIPNIMKEHGTFIFNGQAVQKAQHFKGAMTLWNTWHHSPNNSVAPQEDLNPHNIPNATTVLQITSKQDNWKWNQTKKYNKNIKK